MIPLSATQGYSMLKGRLSDAALVDLDRAMASVALESPQVQKEALMDLMPSLGDQYVGAASLVSAEFFTELQSMNEIRKPIAAETLAGVSSKRWHSLVGWGAAGSMFEQGGSALVYSLLSGGLTKILTEASADTMIGNAALQGGMRSQRVPRAGCCAFCGMLASRFAGYSSEKSAGVVVGRGKPIPRVQAGGRRRSGGQAKGIKPRGSRALGEDFHDFCRCSIVVVTEGNQAQLQAGAEEYYNSYRDAYEKADEGLVRVATSHKIGPGDYKNKYSWATNEGKTVSPNGRIKMIVGAMREDLGVK